jgi:beta-glucosidase
VKSVQLSRREILGAASLIAGGLIARPLLAATQTARPHTFPKGFMWGAATAAYQIEGNNISSDYWVLENVKPTLFRTRSGDACDSYHRYEDDIALLRSIGLDSYRFSIEWARIEPEKGSFSIAELDYYKRVIATCRKNGVRPTVTFHHNTSPRWFAAEGGWTNPDAPKLFARYCEYSARAIAPDIDVAYTINEPNVNQVIAWIPRGIDEKMAMMMKQGLIAMNSAAAKAVGSDKFSPLIFSPSDAVTPQLIEAHHQSFAAIKAVRGNLPVGVPLSVFEYEGVGRDNKAETARREVLGEWIEAARRSGDFVGVQNYGRVMVDDKGPVKSANPAENAPFEPYAPSLGNTVRYLHQATNKPIIVSENGMDTVDDNARIRYIDAALTGLANAMAEGVPVLGYYHWSLIDNFEWLQGFTPKYGLASVDPTTFKRTPKPSASHLGKIAQDNRL